MLIHLVQEGPGCRQGNLVLENPRKAKIRRKRWVDLETERCDEGGESEEKGRGGGGWGEKVD